MEGNLLRRARIRKLAEGKVQQARVEALDDDAKDGCERWQDYGFAGNPGDGQGLAINVAGHTIVLRCDRIAERPHLQQYEVSVWHKEGHYVTLKAGRVVEIGCDELVVNAATSVTLNSPSIVANASAGIELNTPTVAASEAVTAGTSIAAGTNITAQGDISDQAGAKSMAGMRTAFDAHTHDENDVGGATDGPVPLM